MDFHCGHIHLVQATVISAHKHEAMTVLIYARDIAVAKTVTGRVGGNIPSLHLSRSGIDAEKAMVDRTRP